MALIKCPECGREISDKAVSCPGCGCPVEFMSSEKKSPYDETLDYICEKYLSSDTWDNNQMAKAVKEFRGITGLSFKDARNEIHKKRYGETYAEARQELKARRKEENRQLNAQIVHNLNTIQNAFGGGKVARCPKCHSTSISYQDKISVGRAVVGGTVAGGTGAVLGGLTGKKGYAVCLKCGKRWKI